MIQDWNHRSLHEHVYPFVLVDAIYTKVRENGRVRSRAVLIATGVNEEGYREILGLQIGNSESEFSWSKFFGWLKDRGLWGVDLIISDQHGGLVQAIEKHFQGATWQRCQTHFICNILDAAPKYMQDALLEEIRGILHAPNKQTARLLLEQVLAKRKFIRAWKNDSPLS